jgi:hypothetical protein
MRARTCQNRASIKGAVSQPSDALSRSHLTSRKFKEHTARFALAIQSWSCALVFFGLTARPVVLTVRILAAWTLRVPGITSAAYRKTDGVSVAESELCDSGSPGLGPPDITGISQAYARTCQRAAAHQARFRTLCLHGESTSDADAERFRHQHPSPYYASDLTPHAGSCMVSSISSASSQGSILPFGRAQSGVLTGILAPCARCSARCSQFTKR